MGFLSNLLIYKKICIQCHDNPDADTIGSALAAYRFFQKNGCEVSIVYGGRNAMKKSNTKMLVRECQIPIVHTHEIEDPELLLLVDCQYGENNVEKFDAPNIAIIDHHVQVVDSHVNYYIKSNYQSCSTIMYELLKEEGYRFEEDEPLCVALLYGLYTDTSCFADLFGEADTQMKKELYREDPLFEKLIKSNLSVAELMVASDAMYNHYFDPEYRVAIVSALKCDQSILGMIGDFVIQVDAVYMSFSYTEADAGYQISIRSCVDEYPANKIAVYICDGIGGGGGHKKKAGGRIVRSKMIEKYGTDDLFTIVNERIQQYMEEHSIDKFYRS